jgi:hypothetical protein
MCASSDKEVQQWLSALCQAGATMLPKEKKKSRSLKLFLASTAENDDDDDEAICYTDVYTWSPQLVQKWLAKVQLGNGKNAFQEYQSFKNNKVNGKTLLSIGDDKGLTALGIQDEGHREVLIEAINSLRIGRVFEKNRFNLVKKIQALIQLKSSSKSASEIESLVQALASKETLKHTYLKMDTVREMLKTGDEQEEEEEEPNEFDDLEKSLGISSAVFQKHAKEMTKFPVKLVITEILHSKQMQNVRKALSPFASFIPTLNQEYGIFHTALIVGPWYLEWTDSSLCVPRRLFSGVALLSADLDALDIRKESLDELADKIAEVIVDWNTNKTYCNFAFTGKKPNEGNCQDFVEAVLTKLQIKPKLHGAFGEFVEKMRKFGKCELEFVPPSVEFREKYGLKAESYLFQTHAQLDSFVQQLLDVNNMFSFEHPHEWKLLKAFDRAFWLRFLKSNSNAQATPLMSNNKHRCPFDDPLSTVSYMVMH